MNNIKILNNTVFGVARQLPLASFPKGRKRIRMRNDDFVQVFVKNETGIRRFIVKELNGVWVPACEIGSNTFDTAD